MILLTARATGESKLEGLETGADDYITKPFSPQELQVRVKNLIEQRQKLRERFGREVTLQPKDVAITSADEKFLNRAVEVVEKNMDNPDFSVEAFENAMTMSKMQLYRKLKSLTGPVAQRIYPNTPAQKGGDVAGKTKRLYRRNHVRSGLQ